MWWGLEAETKQKMLVDLDKQMLNRVRNTKEERPRACVVQSSGRAGVPTMDVGRIEFDDAQPRIWFDFVLRPDALDAHLAALAAGEQRAPDAAQVRTGV